MLRLSVHFYGCSGYSCRSVLGCIQNAHKSEEREWCMRGQLSIPHCQSSYLSRFEYPFNTIVDPTDLK